MKIIIEYRPINLNETEVENILQLCRDSSTTWLITHAIYVIILSLAFTNFIVFFYEIFNLMRLLYQCSRNRSFADDEDIDDAFESEIDCLGEFIYQQVVLIFLYIGAAWIFHVLVHDNPITSMLIARWCIEAVVDFHCFFVLLSLFHGFSLSFTYDRSYVYRWTKTLFVAKMSQYCLLRYPEMNLQSDFNTLLVYIFRRYCVADHYSRLTDRPIATFFKEFKYLFFDVGPLALGNIPMRSESR